MSAVQVNVAQPSKAAHSLGIASVILGILAFLICWIPLIGLLGIPLSGLGLLLGIVGLLLAIFRRGHGIGFPIAGAAISLLAIVITVSMTFVVTTAVTAVGTVAEQALEEVAKEFDDQVSAEATKDVESDVPEFEGVQAKPVPINDPDFRNVKWGMSEAEVRAQEQAKLVHEKENIVGYEEKIADLDCYVAYIFTLDKLVRAKYIIQETHTNANDHILDYSALKRLLSIKYGRPTRDETVWRNDLYKDDSDQYGFAVSMGHLLYYSIWKTSETEITLTLGGDNFEFTHGIEYVSKALEHLEDEARETETLKDF